MKLWCDELAAWRQPDAFDQALLGLRLGDRPQAIVTTTPRPTKIIKALAADKDTIVTRGSTFDNKAHLARAFFNRITARYKGRTIGRQELFAEIVEETPGALWTRALIERQRVEPEAAPKRIRRNRRRCRSARALRREIRRVRAHRRRQGRKRPVLCAGRPHQPGRHAGRVGGASRGRLSRLQGQPRRCGNQQRRRYGRGGPASERAQSAGARGHATRGKFLRAEPIAAAYERGLVFHAGTFGKLEDKLCALTPDFDRRSAGYSPDRADALVWALADLLGVGKGSAGGDLRVLCGRGRVNSHCGSMRSQLKGEECRRGSSCSSTLDPPAHEQFTKLCVYL